MKATRAWQRRIKDILLMSGSRQRSRLKRPVWIIVLVTFVIIFLITAFLYPPTTSAACYIFSSRDCTLFNEPSIFTARELSDEETRSHVVFREILNTPPIQSKNPKIAFLFLPPGTLHFEPLWDKFFCVRICSLISIIFVLALHQLCNFFASIANRILLFHSRSFRCMVLLFLLFDLQFL